VLLGVLARTAALPWNLLDGLHKAGHDLEQLACGAGLAFEDLRRPMTEEQADRFLAFAYAQIGDPAAGLVTNRSMRPELFGVVGLSALASPTFGAALVQLAQSIGAAVACRLEIIPGEEATEVRLHEAGPERPYSRCRIDLQLSALLIFGRQFTERSIVPLRLTLRVAPPPCHARYSEAFSCPVLFGEAHDAIVFHNADLELGLVSARPELASLLGKEARLALADRRAGKQPISRAVRDVLRARLPGSVARFNLAEVACELCMSERTLQRRLAQENCRFSDLLDEVRSTLAERSLLHGDSLSEVAFQLGYADPNSFFRWFKRRNGDTPDRSRRRPSPQPAENTAIDSTCDVCGNMFTAPAARSTYPPWCTSTAASRASVAGLHET